MSDPLQFEKFMRDYQNMVFTTACRLLADEAEAQDIAQEVFLKAFEHFGQLQASPAAGGWLKTVTRNLCLSHLSRHRSRWRLSSDAAGEDPVEDWPADDALTPALDSADRLALLNGALDQLPAAQRVPLVLYHFEDMTYDEIARSLNVSVAKVKVDIHRGRAALRRKLSLHPEARML